MEDDTIVQLYWDREESAITVTDQKYGSYCLTIANNILGNVEDARECVNDTYLNAWNSIPPHRPENLAAYLGKITRNLSFNLYKKNRAKKRGGSQLPLIFEELEEVVLTSAGVEEEYQKKELRKLISQFLYSLPEEKRNLFVCRYWYADSVRDIAKQYGMTENNVSVSLNRMRKKLQKYLTERGLEL